MTGDADDDANTPLTPTERDGLIPSFVAGRADLNVAEQANIARAHDWLAARRRDVLDERTLLRLHARMFGDVWRWAGGYRRTERNIGVAAFRIPVEMRQMLDDIRWRVEQGGQADDETVLTFHHRLVQIHPFPNGNGRHARLAADVLGERLGLEPYTWGGRSGLETASATRRDYVAALRAADGHDLRPLLAFARRPHA